MILRRLILAAVVAGGAVALIWTSLGRWALPEIGPKQPDYYNLLVGGFLKGSLGLDIEVPKALAEAKDPIALFRHDPTGLPHDLSFYKGHFYTYYGVVPTVVLFLPFRVLTGHDLPLVLGALVFGVGGFLVLSWVWLYIVSQYFPEAGTATRAGGIAALGLAGGQWVLARRIGIWEPSIIAGHFFLALSFACALRALNARKPWAWLAGAGLAIGLAAGSRPTLAVAGFGLVPLVIAVGWSQGPVGRPRRMLLSAVAAGIPLAAMGFLIMAYNWARFGDPMEFGLSHQFSTWNLVKVQHFRLAYVTFNFFLYFLAAPQWGRYFPFLHPINYPVLPKGYYGYEYVYGALIVCPVLWWILFAPALIRKSGSGLRPTAAIFLAVAVAVTAVLFCFDTSAARYETDFLPWWVALALVGWCLVEERAGESSRPWLRPLLATVFALTVVFSCATAFCASAELHEILPLQNPEAYRRISRVFNGPVGTWERLSHYKGGALEMDITFAPKPIESVEPLVVTGVEYQRDYAYVYYQSAHVVRFCFIHPGEPVVSSGDVTIIPGRPYRLRLEFGSLYPPRGHPAFDGWHPEEVDAYKHWVRIVLDGKTIASDTCGTNEASPGTVQIGEDKGIGFCGRRFAGTISNINRPGMERPSGNLSAAGDFDLTVALQSGKSLVDSPLITAGAAGTADIFGIRVPEPGKYQFVYEGFGIGIWQSGLFALPEDRTMSLRVRMGATLGIPQDSPLAVLSRSIVVWQDGKPLWWARTARPLAEPPPVYLMSNALKSTEMADSLRGRFVSARVKPEDATWRRGPFPAVVIELGGRGSGIEPLVSTGGKGRVDILSIEWLPNRDARLVYDHGGHSSITGSAFHWDDDRPHMLRLELPGLAHLDATSGSEGEGTVRCTVDGGEKLDRAAAFYDAASASLAIGRNPSGSPSTGDELHSVVIDLGQAEANNSQL